MCRFSFKDVWPFVVRFLIEHLQELFIVLIANHKSEPSLSQPAPESHLDNIPIDFSWRHRLKNQLTIRTSVYYIAECFCLMNSTIFARVHFIIIVFILFLIYILVLLTVKWTIDPIPYTHMLVLVLVHMSPEVMFRMCAEYSQRHARISVRKCLYENCIALSIPFHLPFNRMRVL